MSSSIVAMQVARRRAAAAAKMVHEALKCTSRSISSSTNSTSAPAAAVVPATNLGVNSWSKPQKTSKRTLASTKMTSAPAPSVVPATNLGLHSWSDPQESSAGLFSSLAATAADTQEETLDQEILSYAGNDIDVDMDWLQGLASQSCTPLKLSDMYKYASVSDSDQRLRNAQFLHKELPIRIAQRAVDLLTLPHGLNQTTPIRNVARIYLQYLQKMQQAMPNPPATHEEETRFTDLLQSLVLDRTAIPTAVARGVASWRDTSVVTNGDVQEMERALYRFFTARVGLRFLCEHHILSSSKRGAVRENLLGSSGSELGCIQPDCNVVEEIEGVAAQVSKQVRECYGFAPQINVVDCSNSSSKNFTYVPHHLQYMVSELLKNSCRATVQRHLALKLQDKTVTETSMPPIKVIVAKGAEDVTIKVADVGGGVPRSTMDQIWKFGKSTAPESENKTDFGTNPFTGGATHGFGLPLARIYARYFGGELTLKSTEGYGSDAYLYLPRLGEACENLPERVNVSPGGQDSYPQMRE